MLLARFSPFYKGVGDLGERIKAGFCLYVFDHIKSLRTRAIACVMPYVLVFYPSAAKQKQLS
jgi:hypothetical protein